MVRELVEPVVTQLLALARERPASARSDDRLGSAVQSLAARYPDDVPTHGPHISGAGLRLHALAAVYDLDEVDVTLLLAAVAPEVDALVAQVMTLLGGSPRPTVDLALGLVGATTASAERGRLRSSSALVASDLLEVRGSGPFPAQVLHVAQVVVDHLLGLDDDRGDLLTPAVVHPVAVATPETSVIRSFLAADEQFAYVRERPRGAGLAAVASAVNGEEMSGLFLDLSRLPSGTGLGPVVRAARLRAGLRRQVLVLRGFDAVAAAGAELVSLVLDSSVPVIGIGHDPWQPHLHRVLPPQVEVDPLPRTVVDRLWSTGLSGLEGLPAPDGPLPNLRAEEVVQVVHRLRADLRAGVVLDAGAIRDGARLASGRSGVPGARRTDPAARREDLVLHPRTAAQVDELVDWVRMRRAAQEGGAAPAGMDAVLTGGISALFAGPPGTGKTLAARVVAAECGLELLTVDLAALVDKYVGETEKNLEKVFVAAEEADALLFFDEADALFGSRSAVTDSKDRFANQEIAYLLQRMEAFSGVAVLASNLRGNMDEAFTRRLTFAISFQEPDAAVRRRLWQLHLSKVPLDADDRVDLDVLADKIEVSGGAIQNIVRRAAFSALRESASVGARHLRAAVLLDFEKSSRRPPASW